MSVDNPDNGPADATAASEKTTESRKMKTNACMPNNMTQNAVVQPLLTGLFLSLLFIFIIYTNIIHTRSMTENLKMSRLKNS